MIAGESSVGISSLELEVIFLKRRQVSLLVVIPQIKGKVGKTRYTLNFSNPPLLFLWINLQFMVAMDFFTGFIFNMKWTFILSLKAFSSKEKYSFCSMCKRKKMHVKIFTSDY